MGKETSQIRLLTQADYSRNPRDIESQWFRYVVDGIEPEGIRPMILESWKRSRNDYKVDPNIKEAPIKIGPEELLMRQEQNQELHLARPFLDEFNTVLKDTGCVNSFFDRDGWSLEIQGDPRVLKVLRETDAFIGTCSKENITGTNGAGTAFAEKRPVQILGPEHYGAAWHSLSCYGAPIIDPFSREVVGVIGGSGLREIATPHMLLLVVTAAQAVEQKLRQEQMKKDQELVEQYVKLALGRVSDGYLCIDEQGRIVQMNAAVGRILKLPESGDVWQACPELEQAVMAVVKGAGGSQLGGEQQVYCEEADRYVTAALMPVLRQGRVIGAVAVLPDKGSGVGRRGEGQSERRRRGVLAQARYQFEDILGDGAELRQALKLGRLAAGNTLPVLITGPSGTGKEMFAQAIHNGSQRADKPFITVNCGAIPQELIEAELFGYEAGAFTGARRGGNTGKFERADGGTMFLDEVCELTMNAQVVLLRVLQEMEVVRLGSSLPTSIDVRVIAASNKDLHEEVERGRFRRDLYYRLNVLAIELPTLKKRREEIGKLAQQMLERVGASQGRKYRLSGEALEGLKEYEWPGNVRELKNVMERLAALAEGEEIGWEELPEEIKARVSRQKLSRGPLGWARLKAQHERELLVEVLKQSAGNISEAARHLGISRVTLYQKIKKHSISKLEWLKNKSARDV